MTNSVTYGPKTTTDELLVDVTIDVWDEMIHFWQAFAFTLPEGQQALDRAGEFIREHTPAPTPAP